jgi:hypothetical protein
MQVQGSVDPFGVVINEYMHLSVNFEDTQPAAMTTASFVNDAEVWLQCLREKAPRRTRLSSWDPVLALHIE